MNHVKKFIRECKYYAKHHRSDANIQFLYPDIIYNAFTIVDIEKLPSKLKKDVISFFDAVINFDFQYRESTYALRVITPDSRWTYDLYFYSPFKEKNTNNFRRTFCVITVYDKAKNNTLDIGLSLHDFLNQIKASKNYGLFLYYICQMMED